MARGRTRARGTVERVTFQSRVLRGNPMKDPAAREIAVYLPPGYHDEANREQRYPSVYLLTGYTGRGMMLLNRSGWGEPVDRKLDRLIAAGKVRPLIAVFPDCFTRIGGSQYLDSSATGRYETHLIRELVPWVDGHYRTLDAPEHRAVMGKSSGGYGAIVQGMKHPEIFGSLACHSGDAYFEYCYLPDFPHTLDQLRKRRGVRGFLRAFERAPKKTHDLIRAMNILAMASAYSPNPKATETLGIDLPFDLESGEIRGDVWKRWLRLDPVRMVERHAKNLRKLRYVFLDCGTRDEWNLHWGARMISARLKEAGIAHEHQEFDDGHMDISYRYDVSLPSLSRNLG